ncbi:Major Facilitator Superfamily [Nakaseomyces bracarensis]|uniref:Major Facilitator Superfamily n=1 Tax=Nakaseomyces bracarensis TaxID=273131 RepID=A0ABR4NMK7_9SACH
MSKSNMSTDTDSELALTEKVTLMSGHINLPKTFIREIFFNIVLISSQLLTLIGAVQGVPISGYIDRHFHIAPEKAGLAGWANASFMLGSAVMILMSGKLGDLNGHKRMIVIGWTWYSVWSLITGFSYYDRGNVSFYFTARTLQGVGTGMIIPNTLAIMGRTYFRPCLKKTIVFSLFGMMTSLGFVVGTTFSSLFAQLTIFAWNYWVLAMVTAGYALAAYLFIPPDNIVEKPGAKPIYKRFDYLGALTGIAGMVLYDVAFTQASALGWSPPHTYILLAVGCVLVVLALLIDTRVDDPLVPIKSLRWDVLIIVLCVNFGFLSFVIWANFFWQYFQLVRNDTPLEVAAKLVPLAVGSVPAALFTITLIKMKVKAPTMMVIAMVCFLVPNILMSTITPHTSYWAQPFVSTIIAPFGVDVTVPTATLLLSASVKKEAQGVGAALITTIISFAISIGPSYTAMVMFYTAPPGKARGPGDLTHSMHVNFYGGIVFSGIGLLIAIVAGLVDWRFTKKHCGDIPNPQKDTPKAQPVVTDENISENILDPSSESSDQQKYESSDI